MKLNKLSELLPDTFRYTVFIFNPYLESHVETNLVQGFSEISKDNKKPMAIYYYEQYSDGQKGNKYYIYIK